MERILRRHALETPDAEAIVEESRSLTYSGLISAAEGLVSLLLAQGPLDAEEPVVILLRPGLDLVVSQVAVRLAGATCVPLDMSLPAERIRNMMRDIHARRLVLNHERANDFRDLSCIIVSEGMVTGGRLQDSTSPFLTENAGRAHSNDGKASPGCRSHILFTSGSTGKPKPVQVSEEAILHLSHETPITPLLKGDRVAEYNRPGWDSGLFEIWVTLLSGATIVNVPKSIATDANTLSRFLTSNKITVLLTPTALFNIIVSVAPHTYRSLRHVIVGGEAADPRAVRSVLSSQPPEHLWNAYGPTETTVFSTLLEIDSSELNRGRIGIGYPVGRTEIVLMGDGPEPIRVPGIRGEICIGRPGLSLGYLNLKDENMQRFIAVPPAEEGPVKVQVYRTGDLGEWRSDRPGCLDFFGRMDQQVKHMTFRVELDEVARSLQTNPRIRSAVVVKPPGSQILIACVVPREEGDAISPNEVIQRAKNILPYYMLPGKVNVLSSLPMTANGKVDRQALMELGAEPPCAEAEELRRFRSIVGDLKESIVQIWRDVLQVPLVGQDDDFFLAGGTSMQAAALIALILKQLNRVVTMDELYSHSRLVDLLSFLDAQREVTHGVPAGDTGRWLEDAKLADELPLALDEESDEEEQGRVFMTGATGFIGAHLLHRLLRAPGVSRVVCLARSANGRSAEDRVRMALDKYDLRELSPEHLGKLSVLDGNMAQADLGLGVEQFAWLAGWASVVFHIGAKANFNESYEAHFADNVLGTLNVLRVAATGRRKAFHYTSSLDVWGPTGSINGTVEVTEEEPLLRFLGAQRYDMGYSQSQWVAEMLVRRLMRRGLPCVVYRLGFVIGDSATGAGNPNDLVSRMLVDFIQMGAMPRLQGKRFEFVTLDYVLDVVLHVAASRENLGRCFGIVPPDQTRSVTFEELAPLLRGAGYPVRVLEYGEWLRDVLQAHLPDGALACMLPLLQERVMGQLTRLELGQWTPRVDATNTARATADRPDIQFVKFTPEILLRYIEFWNRKGFYSIPPPGEPCA